MRPSGPRMVSASSIKLSPLSGTVRSMVAGEGLGVRGSVTRLSQPLRRPQQHQFRFGRTVRMWYFRDQLRRGNDTFHAPERDDVMPIEFRCTNCGRLLRTPDG